MAAISQVAALLESAPWTASLCAALLQQIPEGAVIVGSNGRVLLENQVAAMRVGRSASRRPAADWCRAVGLYTADASRPVSIADLVLMQCGASSADTPIELTLRGAFRERHLRIQLRVSVFNDAQGEMAALLLCFDDSDLRDKHEGEDGARARLDAVLQSIRTPALTCSTDGRVIDWNDAAHRTFGYSPQQMFGQPITALMMDGERRRFGRLGVDSHQAHDREFEMRHQDGRALQVAWSTAPVLDASGHIVGVAASGSDMTDQAGIERELTIQADRQRQELGHDLHDSLGQQLTALGLLSNALAARTGPDDPLADMSKRIDHAIDAAKSQLRTIIMGLAPVEIETRQLTAALEELVATTQRSQSVDCRLECPVSVVPADDFTANQLYLIAREALHNAIKHAAPRSVVIRLENVEAGVRMTVRDDGVGIKKPTSAYREAGLGLRIMEYRCRLIGGSLTIDCGEGGGTVLTCQLRGAPKPRPVARPTRGTGELYGRRT